MKSTLFEQPIYFIFADDIGKKDSTSGQSWLGYKSSQSVNIFVYHRQ